MQSLVGQSSVVDPQSLAKTQPLRSDAIKSERLTTALLYVRLVGVVVKVEA
jgi:hypothetical protein